MTCCKKGEKWIDNNYGEHGELYLHLFTGSRDYPEEIRYCPFCGTDFGELEK